MTDKELRSGEDSIVQKPEGKAVRERQTRFRRISAITSDIAYSCHTKKDGRFSIDWMTGAADRITGYSIEEIKVHGCWRFLVVEEDIPLFEKHVIGLAPGSRGSCELRIRHKNGSIVWISSFAECVAEAKIPGRLLYGGLTEITERKQAEEKLSASETRYRRLFEDAKDGILILDADTGMIVDANSSLTEMLGFSRDEFLGKHIWDLGFFRGIVANEADFLKLQQNEYIRYEDVPLQTADGRRINVEFVSNLYPVGQAKVIQCSLRGAHLASFPAQNPYPVVEVGIDGAVRFANPAAMATLARFGLDPDARQFLPGTPEELGLLRSQCERNPQTQELHLGGEIFVRVVTAPPGGDTLHVYAIDITERYQAERVLRELGTFNEQIISSATEGIVVYGPDLRYQTWNPYMEKLTGLAASEVLGRQPLELFPFLQEEGVIQRVERVLLGEKVEAAIVPYGVEKSGRSGWTEDVTSPLLDSQAKIVGAIGIMRDITERKHAEETLHNERLLLRTLIDNIPDSIYSKDLACRKTLANLTEARYLGVKSEADVLGKDDFDIYPKELAEKFFADDQLVLQTGEPVLNREEYIFDEKQEKRWLLTSKLPLRNQEGRIIGLVGIGRDITDRKQAEEEIQRERAFFDRLVESAPEGIAIADTQGRIMRVNAEFVRMFGYGVDEVVGQYLDDLVAPPARQEEAKALTRSTIQGEKNLLETVRRRKDGTLVDVSLIGASILVAGKQEAVYAIYRDITDRKRAEEALRASEALYQSLVKVSPLSICRKDLSGRFTFANQRFLEALNPSLADLIGLTDFDLHPPELAEKYRRDDRAVMDSGEAREFIEERAVLGGESTIIQSYKTPIYDGAGKINGVQISFWDITERKQAEAEKEALQAQLHQSQKMEAIGTLAGGVAHDFNNLLTGILGNIALMRSSVPPADPLLENLNAAETAARQAADLTKGLLTFGRSAMVLPVPMKIADALDATLVLLRQSLPATMEIVRDYEQTAWNVLVDQSQMTQILFNLAVNARDAMEGKGMLTIRARNEVVGEEYLQTHPFARIGEFVHLSVTDTGAGIPPAILEHLFEPFHTTKPVGSGTGLGLSIVYGAVKQAGGWITAVSTEGAGKTAPQKHPSDWENILGGIEQTCSGAAFDIYLPRCLETPPQSPPPSSPSVNVARGTVLVVEDEPVVRTVAQALLSRSGYTILTAPDGASALNILRDHPVGIGLILLDMTMPGMTTNEIVQAIRAVNRTVPILLNSGYTSNDAVRRMLEEGSVQGFLGKPYDLPQLLENVQRLLHRG